MYEPELVPLFEECGKIHDLRLMMDSNTGQPRGYAFVTFCEKGAAAAAKTKVIINALVVLLRFAEGVSCLEAMGSVTVC